MELNIQLKVEDYSTLNLVQFKDQMIIKLHIVK